MTRKLDIPSRAPFLKGDVVAPEWVAYFTQLGTHIRNILVASPVEADHHKCLIYDHTNAKFDYFSPGGGITLFPWFRDSVGQGTWVSLIGGSYFYGAIYSNTTGAADGDNFTWKRYLAAGTYTIGMAGYRSADHAIIDVDIDGVEVASFDMYGATVAWVWPPDAGNAIETSGIKSIKMRIDGRHASSTGWKTPISALNLYRTA